jgi:hypothetical protein
MSAIMRAPHVVGKASSHWHQDMAKFRRVNVRAEIWRYTAIASSKERAANLTTTWYAYSVDFCCLFFTTQAAVRGDIGGRKPGEPNKAAYFLSLFLSSYFVFH